LAVSPVPQVCTFAAQEKSKQLFEQQSLFWLQSLPVSPH
jgi:hypothetical protein